MLTALAAAVTRNPVQCGIYFMTGWSKLVFQMKVKMWRNSRFTFIAELTLL